MVLVTSGAELSNGSLTSQVAFLYCIVVAKKCLDKSTGTICSKSERCLYILIMNVAEVLELARQRAGF